MMLWRATSSVAVVVVVDVAVAVAVAKMLCDLCNLGMSWRTGLP